MSRVPPCGALPARLTPNHPELPAGAVRRAQQIESLLSELESRIGSQITRGGRVQERSGRLPVGIPAIDRLLGGGFPEGALSEITGAASSGRTSLALALLATATAKGELVAWVDAADAFDPLSARGRGVDLERVLWVRASGWREALRATERLVRTEGFPLVLLDGSTSRSAPRSTHSLRDAADREVGSSWLRLARLLPASNTTLLLLSHERLAGPHAALAIEMQPARARFSGTPALLDELESRMTLVRNRTGPVDPQSSQAIPFSSRPASPSSRPASSSARPASSSARPASSSARPASPSRESAA